MRLWKFIAPLGVGLVFSVTSFASSPTQADSIRQFFTDLEPSDSTPAELRRTFTDLIAKKRKEFSEDVAARRATFRKEIELKNQIFQAQLKEAQTPKERDQKRFTHYAEEQAARKKAEGQIALDQKAIDDSIKAITKRFETSYATLVDKTQRQIRSDKLKIADEFRQLDKVPTKPLGTAE